MSNEVTGWLMILGGTALGCGGWIVLKALPLIWRAQSSVGYWIRSALDVENSLPAHVLVFGWVLRPTSC